MKAAHILAQAPENKIRTVLRPLGTVHLYFSCSIGVRRALPAISEYEFARPQAILTGLPLRRVRGILPRGKKFLRVSYRSADAGLRHAIEKTELLVPG